VDTPPSEYVDEAGKPSFSPAGAECLARGLKIAASVLGPDVFEDLCLQGVWYALGVRYDAARGLLVPVGSPSSSA
ncbi:MAG TPA: hypothetical protein PLC79_00475, partial [Phycisphaerae bacterium]|nr:hypothetical protein [Phycisphaerae bacterium]